MLTALDDVSVRLIAAGLPLRRSDLHIFGLLATGLTQGQAARRMGISESGLRRRVWRANGLLGADTTLQAAVMLERRGLLPTDIDTTTNGGSR